MAIARGYCTTGDVQLINYYRNYLQNDLNSQRPGSSDVEDFIDLTIDDINMTLSTVGYTLPVTETASPYGYYFIKHWNAVGAAEKLERRHGSKENADMHLEAYERMEEQILSHDVILTDVPGAPTQGSIAKSGTSELTSAGETRTPFFTRDQDF